MSERTTFHRRPQRGTHDRAVIDAIVDEALVCHVAFAAPTPMVIPTAHVRVGDDLYIHGAVANHMLSALADGGEACIAVTLIDGLVLARTAFHHSMNYRSVVAFGRGRTVTDPEEKRRVLAALLDKMVANRSRECRPPDDTELGATRVIAFPLTEASAKIRKGPPLADTGDDAALSYSTGVIPVSLVRG